VILVPTVPHTGTHFVKQLLEGVDDFVNVKHPYPGKEFNLVLGYISDGHPCIIPRRQRGHVIDSWRKYGKDIHDFAGWSLDRWLQVRDALALCASEAGGCYWLDIDLVSVRDEQLRIINSVFELNLVTDWRPVRQAAA
jgi:hypothetical protein